MRCSNTMLLRKQMRLSEKDSSITPSSRRRRSLFRPTLDFLASLPGREVRQMQTRLARMRNLLLYREEAPSAVHSIAAELTQMFSVPQLSLIHI